MDLGKDKSLQRFVLRSASNGVEADLSSDRGETGPSRPALGADFLYDLCTSEEYRLHPRGIRIRGARITGVLDFAWSTLRYPLVLRDCLLEAGLRLNNARARSILLSGCMTTVVEAEQLVIEGDLRLDGAFQATDVVRLIGARVGGALSLREASLGGRHPFGLHSPRIEIGGDCLLDGIVCAGGIDLSNASIGGRLSCRDATITSEFMALHAAGISTGGSILLSNARIQGHVNLVGASTNSLICSGARLVDPEGRALNARGATVRGTLALNHGFIAEGQVSLTDASIGETLTCRGGTMANPRGLALDARRVKVADQLLLDEDFRLDGAALLAGASLDGEPLRAGSGSFKTGPNIGDKIIGDERKAAEPRRHSTSLLPSVLLAAVVGIVLTLYLGLLLLVLISFWPSDPVLADGPVNILGWTLYNVPAQVRLLAIAVVSSLLGASAASASTVAASALEPETARRALVRSVLHIPTAVALSVIIASTVLGGVLSTFRTVTSGGAFAVAALSALAGLFAKPLTDALRVLVQSIRRRTGSDTLDPVATVSATLQRSLKDPAFIREITSGISDRLIGPVLDNYTGFVSVAVHLGGQPVRPPAGGVFIVGANRVGRLSVTVGAEQPSSAPFQELAVTDGNQAELVSFDIIAEFQGGAVNPPQASINVTPNDREATATFAITTPVEPGLYPLFVQVLQKNRLIQVLRTEFNVESEVSA